MPAWGQDVTISRGGEVAGGFFKQRFLEGGVPMFFVKGFDGFSSSFLGICFWAPAGCWRCVPVSWFFGCG
jgi:hypothetical protein